MPLTAARKPTSPEVREVPKPVVSRCSKTECAILRLRFYEARFTSGAAMKQHGGGSPFRWEYLLQILGPVRC